MLLDYYEKAFSFARTYFVVFDLNNNPRDVTGYMPLVSNWIPAEPWDSKEWIATYGEVTMKTAVEAMASMDNMLSRIHISEPTIPY